MLNPFVIQTANLALLVLIFIGFPAITRLKLGGALHLSASQTLDNLIFAGLGLGVALNLSGLYCFAKSNQLRRCYRYWILCHGFFLAVYFAYVFGWIEFQWLKAALLQIKDWLS